MSPSKAQELIQNPHYRNHVLDKSYPSKDIVTTELSIYLNVVPALFYTVKQALFPHSHLQSGAYESENNLLVVLEYSNNLKCKLF